MIQTIPYKNGHLLAYAEDGDKNGYPVLVQHGLIASIAGSHLFDRLIESGTRVIRIARPGYGESSPYAMKNMAEWGEIVSVLVEELELYQFDVLGISSGAPYSYAIGYRLPEKVRNIFILSGTPALYAAQVVSAWPYPVNKDASIAELQALAYEIFFSGLSEEDLANNRDIQDSLMNNCFGIAQDLKLRSNDWGFCLQDVNEKVYMRHSQADTSVPFVTAQMTAQLLPNCTFDIKENDEHFSSQLFDDFIKTVMAKQLCH